MLYRLFVALLVANKGQATKLFLAAFGCFYAVAIQKTHENISLLIAISPFALGFGIVLVAIIFFPIWILVVRKEARSRGAKFREFVMSPAYDELLDGYSKDMNKK